LLLISVRLRFCLGFCLILLTSGCQQIGVSAVEPKPTIRVELSPTLQYLSPAIQACSLHGTGLHIILEEKPASEMGKTNADVSLRWGDTKIGTSKIIYRLGSDRLIFAGHKTNPLKLVTIDQASMLINGRIITWGSILERVCPDCASTDAFANQPLEHWQYQPGEDISFEIARITFYNHTGILSKIWIAPNPQKMSDAITNNTAAVGWLPARWLNENLKEIAITDINPIDLAIPVIAITPNQPLPIVNEWLTCLQSTYNN
jgi:hypothetical protein